MKLSAFSIFCNPAVLGVALASGLVLCACGDPQAKSSETARVPAEVIVPTPRPESPDVWRAPAFEFTDQNGSPVNLASLSGRVWIANFVFTQCTTICPTLSAKMALLRRRLPQQDLRFVSFSVDPAHDDEAALTAYAARFGPPDPRWILCRTTPTGLDAVVKGMKVRAFATDDVKNPIVHSNRFLLVDGTGRVLESVDSDDDEACARLVTRCAALVHGEAGSATVSGTETGESLFANLGCMACHSDNRLAPALGGLARRPVRLEGGTTTTADAAYVREALLDPHARLVAGYGPTMPSYRAVLDDAACARLVDHVLSLGGPVEPTPSATAPEKAHDPICGMTVTVREKTPRASHAGKTWYFCCEGCREEFEADPAKYAKE